MHSEQGRPKAEPSESAPRPEHPRAEGLYERGDATIIIEDRLEVANDEDQGGDPYNRSGRFRKLVR
jgi:hypothetical protein